MPFLGVDPLRQLHRARDVREEHGDRLALALERALRGEDLLDEVARRVGTRLRRRLPVRARRAPQALQNLAPAGFS